MGRLRQTNMQIVNWPDLEDKGIKRIFKSFIRKLRGESDIYRLINKGMKVGEKFWCGDGCAIDTSFCYLIEIGNNVTLSNRVQIITHDSSLWDFVHRTKLGLVQIDDFAFVGARTLIMPGVHIGEGAIIAAGSLITKDIPSGEVWGGYPAKKMMDRSDLEKKFCSDEYKMFGVDYLNTLNEKTQQEVVNELKCKKRCFIS